MRIIEIDNVVTKLRDYFAVTICDFGFSYFIFNRKSDPVFTLRVGSLFAFANTLPFQEAKRN